MPFIRFENVSKEYQTDLLSINALKKINLEINKGEIILINGHSGSGKTTFLKLLACLDKPSFGNVYVNDINLTKLKGRKLLQYKRKVIGFVMQEYELIKKLTVLENIKLVTELCKTDIKPKEILKKLGLQSKEDFLPNLLSNEEKQKTAIAMAICKKPEILLLDEPTSTMTLKSAKQILKLLETLSKKEKTTIIITIHDENLSNLVNNSKTINFKNGSVLKAKKNTKKITLGDKS